MGPSKKRIKTTPSVVDSSDSTKAVDAPSSPAQPSATVAESSGKSPSTKYDAPVRLKRSVNDVKSGDGSAKDLKSRGSWYGTWPRKSIASTQVAKETILADKPTNASSSDLSKFEQKRSPSTTDGRPSSMLLGKSKETLDITKGETTGPATVAADKQTDAKEVFIDEGSKSLSTHGAEEAPVQGEGLKEDVQKGSDSSKRPASSAGWFGVWGGRPTTIEAAEVADGPAALVGAEQPPISKPQASEPLKDPPSSAVTAEAATKSTPAPPVTTSWFGLWSASAPSTLEDAKDEIPVKLAETEQDTVMEDVPAENPAAQPTPGSSWAFWSTEATKKSKDLPKDPKEPGQLAVAGEESQNKPEPAKTATLKETKKGKVPKRERPLSTEIDQAIKDSDQETLKKPAQLEPITSKVAPSQSPAPAKTGPPNLLMPSVRSTYRLIENPSILQQIARLILRGQQQPSKHVFLVKEPPKINKALAIGIHGLFPAPLLRTVIGQPTGTSIRFANHAAAAIRRWGDEHGCPDCEIEKVALEGEGKIAERVDNLWNLLLNWIDHVRKADFILVACHSQGVPVAVMLVAKLIEFGVVSTGRIGICAMAGVSLGPFADYKSRLFSGSAGELFDFADPESTVSKRYEDALRVAVKYGVRVTYCGSIDDQLVSMESSIFSTATHPYIYRAVFVDGRIHAPNFLSHLIGFALKLRNLGVSDHGLIRELSAPLAGSLYTGEGHSRLYDDLNVYDLAIEHALETSSVGDIPLQLKKYEIPTNANPYVLPWIMRGLLEEDFVKTELDTEVTELLKQFDEWKPATKVLKDVKYRLEAVRSKL